MNPVDCANCGGRCCVCSDDITGRELWDAHCQDCENTIGKFGHWGGTATTKQGAIERWNFLNAMLEASKVKQKLSQAAPQPHPEKQGWGVGGKDL